MTEMFFIMQGGFGLYHYQRYNPANPLPPFLVIGRNATYGDYSILFDLVSNMDFQTYVYDPRHKVVEALLRKEDWEAPEYVVMVLQADKLSSLCELYPRTALSLRTTALDRRNYHLRHMQ